MKVKNYFLALMVTCVVWQGLSAMDKNEPLVAKKEASSLYNFIRGCIVGGAVGVAEVTVNQPLIGFKTAVQRGVAIPWTTPSVWYRGYAVNAGSMGPITALQMGTNALLTSALAKDGQELSDSKKVFVAALSGAVSALVCPAEYAMTCQQRTGKALYPTVRELWAQGFTGFYRGFISTAMRDGKFTAGYIAVAPLAKRMMMPYVDNEWLATLAGGMVTGVGATVVTQPWDMIRARMQLSGEGNVRETIRQLYKEGGVISFWKGGYARGTRVVLAITLMGALTDPLSEQFARLGL